MKSILKNCSILFKSPVLYIFLLWGIFLITLYYINIDSSFFMDDLLVIFKEPYNWDGFWNRPDHGNYIAHLYNQFFGFYLPDKFHIHPQDFLNNTGILLRCFLFIFLPFFALSFTFLNKKKSFFYPIFFILYFLLFFNILNYSPIEFSMSTAFLRMTFPLLLWSCFYLFFAKYYLVYKNFNIISWFIICLLGLLLGNSSEIMTLITIISAITLFCLEFFFSRKETFIEKLKNIKIYYYIPFIFVLTGFYFLVTHPEFILQVKIKLERFPDVNIYNTIPLWAEFLKEFINQIIYRHLFIIIINIFLLFYLIKYGRKEYPRHIKLVISMLFGIFGFFMSLFFVGKTHYFGGFWLVHQDFHFILEACLLITASLMIGIFSDIFVKNIKSSEIKKIFLILLAGICFLSSCYTFCVTAKDYRHKSKIVRENMYLYDKITLFYWLQGKEAVVPYQYAFCNIASFLSNKELTEMTFNKEDDRFHEQYMISVYPDVEPHGYVYVSKDEAFDKFRKSGGTFIEKELSNIKFQRLRDFDFILNKKTLSETKTEREKATE